MDFVCGFQVNLSSGSRSRNFLVIGACTSNSARNDCAMVIVILLVFGEVECFEIDARLLFLFATVAK
jgi:hypothetical protein